MTCTVYHMTTARAEVEGVDRYPTNADARKANIELAVQFLKQDGVKIQGEAVRGTVCTPVTVDRV